MCRHFLGILAAIVAVAGTSGLLAQDDHAKICVNPYGSVSVEPGGQNKGSAIRANIKEQNVVHPVFFSTVCGATGRPLCGH